jgi:hypothetical protein
MFGDLRECLAGRTILGTRVLVLVNNFSYSARRPDWIEGETQTLM